MPCLFTNPKMFPAGPNFWSQPRNLTAYSASSKTFVAAQKTFYWMQIIILSGTKCLWLPQYINKILVWHKKFGPVQNILGPIKGQGISFFKCSLEIRIEPFSGQWRRRDSRPLLSPEPDGGSRSREGSPSLSGGRSLLGRRRSSAEGGGSSSGSKDRSGECSREHSPQGKSFFIGHSFSADGGSGSREGSPSLSGGRSLLGRRRSSAEGGGSSSGSKDRSGECSREHSPQGKNKIKFPGTWWWVPVKGGVTKLI